MIHEAHNKAHTHSLKLTFWISIIEEIIKTFKSNQIIFQNWGVNSNYIYLNFIFYNLAILLLDNNKLIDYKEKL